MDLQAIREKLLYQRQQYGPSAAEEAPVDWSYSRPQSSIPATPSPAAPSPQLVNAVETLQQRSTQGTAGQPPLAPDTAGWSPDLVAQISIHQQRLQAIVEQINDLSDRQERAMLEMKTVAERLDLEQRRQQRYEAQTGLAQSLPLAVSYEEAIVAAAEQDDQGNIVLTYRTADLHQADREATRLAQTLRDRNRPRFKSPQPSFHEPGLSTLLAEPLDALSGLWQWACDLAPAILSQVKVPASPTRPQRSSFTLLDGVIWFGGGVIGRLALNLVLAAYPGLWSLAVAAVTGMTAYALYRATLAPRLEFGLAYRVLLAVSGLIVGGRLF
ncbi:MAG: hypothetical protein ICV77_00805 [Cyanobacteria bacterium Co-bin8]|nr:hypothetical protein [Cyanobacteria bacterium Co-bin8]